MQFQYLYETTGLTGVVLSVVWYILIPAAGWKMYEKANEPGWKSIIPIYNTYTCYKFTWGYENLLDLHPLQPLLARFCPPAGFSRFPGGHGADDCPAVQAFKAFGHGVGFTVGLFFLRPIFLLILGFGDRFYLGKQD